MFYKKGVFYILLGCFFYLGVPLRFGYESGVRQSLFAEKAKELQQMPLPLTHFFRTICKYRLFFTTIVIILCIFRKNK